MSVVHVEKPFEYLKQITMLGLSLFLLKSEEKKMPINVFCPYCHEFVPLDILKTEVIIRADGLCSDMHYMRCKNCHKIWIEYDEYNEDE